ncbi:MAG: radical SAM family heme chaperone HemW [Dehalococcoidia bacterium]|jgi:oxygen-independent coproporphyrinogen III oxidase
MMGLYIHIPFCVSKCRYCDFYSLAGKEELIDRYLSAVVRETEKYEGMPFKTLYIGGGTPSLLGPRRLARLMDGLHSHLKINKLVEATIEANPESTDEDFLKAARNTGFNRISIGVQSLNDNELRKAGRVHSSVHALKAIDLAFRCGINNISADIIIGLPGQTSETLDSTLRTLVGTGLTHVSAYCLSIEKGTAFAACPPDDLPDDDVQARMYESVSRILKGYGFIHYEISNFALRGEECLHNLNYWRGGEYVGLGPSAASHVNGRRWKNSSNMTAYINNPATSGFDEDIVDIETKIAEEAMLRLRLLEEGLDMAQLTRRHGLSKSKGLEDRLNYLVGQNMLVKKGKKYKLAPGSILTSNRVFMDVIN